MTEPIIFSAVEELDEINQALGWDIQYHQLEKGKFYAKFKSSEGGGISLVTETFNKHLLINCAPPKGFISFLLPSLTDGRVSACGKYLSKGELISFPSTSEMMFITHNTILNEAVFLPEVDFLSASRHIVPSATLIQTGSVKIHKGDRYHFKSIQHQIRQLQQTKNLNDETASLLLTSIILWLADSHVQTGKEYLPYYSKGLIAQKAMTYIENNFHESIKLEDLCVYTGVGLRSLQRCFASYFQISPVAYIKARRLNEIRRCLVKAEYYESTVTQIALANGILHLGRFSADYLAHFGELPSETLKKTKTFTPKVASHPEG